MLAEMASRLNATGQGELDVDGATIMLDDNCEVKIQYDP